jgi:alkylation response protein AidB-like acyl-CoA dehydrogenase
MDRNLYTTDHEDYRRLVREFVAREVTPNLEKWNADRSTGREVWLAAGRQGLIGLTWDAEHGGAGLADYRFRMVVCEEFARVGASALTTSFGLQDDIVAPYVASFGTAEQKQRWLPAMARGEYIMAIAMTEPGAGSDLKGIRTSAIRTPEGWRLTGSKTFISSGILADGVIVVARTDPDGGSDGFTLFVVEAGAAGFERGRKLDKIGLIAQDTAELFFDDVLVPEANLLGDLGGGLRHLMHNLPVERLSIAMGAAASAAAALDWTVAYAEQRQAFGAPIADLQNTRFVLAEVATQVDVLRTYVDHCLRNLNAGTLTAVDAAKAKLWAATVQNEVIDRCLQVFGGYGYMLEYPIARAFVDARVQTIYGGTSEIMKEIIGRDLFGRR